MRTAEPAASMGGSLKGRRRAALYGAAGILTAALVACQGADPYYRNARPGGTGGAGGGDPSGRGGASIDPLVDAGSEASGGQAAAADGGGAGGASETLVPADADPDASGAEIGCGTCALGVLYWCEGTSANTIRATFSLVNETPQAIPLDEITIRYWFTGSGSPPWDFACDNGMLGMVPDNMDVTADVTGTFHSVSPPRPGADMYFEVGFAAAAGDLLSRQDGLFRTRVFRHDYSTITQSDDYSYTPANTTFGPAPHVTLYRNGMLIDGVEPQPN
ncbi:MAG TPA: cellulose binding domain-containing protein [Polyangia bacterium]|nr:cellulose binding domain-containing protein [Polyangia bacterium]